MIKILVHVCRNKRITVRTRRNSSVRLSLSLSPFHTLKLILSYSLTTGNEYFHNLTSLGSRLYIELKYNDFSFRYVDYSNVMIDSDVYHYMYYYLHHVGTMTGNASKNLIQFRVMSLFSILLFLIQKTVER